MPRAKMPNTRRILITPPCRSGSIHTRRLYAGLTPQVADDRVLAAVRSRASSYIPTRVVVTGGRSIVFLGVAFVAATASCARTQLQSAPSTGQVRQVAYLKAANPDMGDHFACGGSLPGHIGNAVAVSTDGN